MRPVSLAPFLNMMPEIPTEDELVWKLRDARVRNDVGTFIEAELALEKHILERAYILMGACSFDTAAAAFREVHQLNRDLVGVVDSAPSKLRKSNIGHRARAERLAADAAGAAAFAEGLASHYAIQNEAAALHFSEASSHYELAATLGGSPRSSIMAQRAEAMAQLSRGLDDLERASFSAAAIVFMRAQATCEHLVEEMAAVEDQEFKEVAADIERDALSCAAGYHLASLRDCLVRGNADAAFEHGAKLYESHALLLERFTPDLPSSLRHILAAESHEGRAMRAVAHAEVLKEQRDWAQAIEAYGEARREYEIAAEEAVRSRLPRAGSLQVRLLNEASHVDLTRRHAVKDRELDEKASRLERELAELRTSVVNKLKDRGFTVNTTAEVVASIDQQAQIVLNADAAVRNLLASLRELLSDRKLPAPDCEAVEQELAGLEVNEERGPRFLARVRRAMDRVAPILTAAGLMAGPVSQIVTAILTLVGQPGGGR